MGTAIGLLAGSASALFMALLDRTLRLRAGHLWLAGLLPLFGMASAWVHHRWGKEAESGGTLILDDVIEFQGRVPSRMAPLVLAGTFLTHLGGGITPLPPIAGMADRILTMRSAVNGGRNWPPLMEWVSEFRIGMELRFLIRKLFLCVE